MFRGKAGHCKVGSLFGNHVYKCLIIEDFASWFLVSIRTDISLSSLIMKEFFPENIVIGINLVVKTTSAEVCYELGSEAEIS